MEDNRLNHEAYGLEEIDRHVGLRIRERRTMLGLTQHDLAKLIGVTYQQAHKYEKGINRVSASRLFGIARAMNVEVGYFFEGLDALSSPLSEHQRQSLDLVRNFAKIRNARHQQAVSTLCRALADTEDGLAPVAAPSHSPGRQVAS